MELAEDLAGYESCDDEDVAVQGLSPSLAQTVKAKVREVREYFSAYKKAYAFKLWNKPRAAAYVIDPEETNPRVERVGSANVSYGVKQSTNNSPRVYLSVRLPPAGLEGLCATLLHYILAGLRVDIWGPGGGTCPQEDCAKKTGKKKAVESKGWRKKQGISAQEVFDFWYQRLMCGECGKYHRLPETMQ